MLVLVLDLIVEMIDPKYFLRDFAFRRPIIFPATFKPEPALRRILRFGNVHVTKSRRNRIGRGLAFRQFGERYHDVDGEITGGLVVGRDTHWKMEIGPIKRTLSACDAKHLCECLEQRCFSGRVRADNRGQVAGNFDTLRVRSEGSKASYGYGLNAHVMLAFVAERNSTAFRGQAEPNRRGRGLGSSHRYCVFQCAHDSLI
jgi:hypothetical protein